MGTEFLDAMRVCQLKLNSFRNYQELDLVPGEGLNILYGENAQGKSNVLEAISLLATTRSLRAGRESELILRDAETAHVQAEIDREREGDTELQLSVFQGDKKAVRINGLKRPRVIDLLGHFNAVFFGALDLAIVTGEPSDRRHYLNIEISQISPRYVYDLGHYKRVLAQRNRILRDLRERPRPPEDTGLSAWNEQLIAFGAPLFDKRRFYIERLAPLADQIHRELTDDKEGLEVRYVPSITLPPAALPAESAPPSAVTPLEGTVREASTEERYLADADRETRQDEDAGAPPPEKGRESALSATERVATAFREQQRLVAAEEARRGTTLLGPQRDDLNFFINGVDARIYGSQGQQRTVALALKLAEFRLIEDYVGEPPVMLLDDVMSDLDDARRAHLLHWIRRRCQTFLTCTNLRYFPADILADATIFHVVAGTVTAVAKE
jgi:DNA replication and repair protein RecF